MKWEGCENKWSWPNLRHYSGIVLEVERGKLIYLSERNQDSNGVLH